MSNASSGANQRLSASGSVQARKTFSRGARKVLEINKKFGNEDEVFPEAIESKIPSRNWTIYLILYRP